MNDYFLLLIYLDDFNGEPQLIKTVRYEFNFPSDEEIEEQMRECAGTDAKVERHFEMLPFA